MEGKVMYRNGEHYPDPTFDEAYANIRREQQERNGDNYIPWVYIASPYRGDVETNTKNALKYSRFVASRDCVPMCPHIYFTRFLDDNNEKERNKGLNLALQMLKRCKEMWVFGDVISEGMKSEIRVAKKRGIPIRYFTSDCKEVKGE